MSSKAVLKEDKNFIKKKSVIRVLYLLYTFFILYIFFSNLSIECKQRRIQLNDSAIHLKIKGPGNNSIFSNEFNNLPNETYINGIQQNEIARYYDFSELENNITLIWKYELDSTSQMFKGCSSITEIDFSYCDISRVISTIHYLMNVLNWPH